MKNSSANATVVEDLSYQRDSIGNITRVADASGKTVQYTYDPLYRLRTVDSTDNTEDRGYTYDSVGNRLTAMENGTTTYYCYHATNCSQAPAGNRLYNLRTGSATGPISRQFTYTDSGQVREKRTGGNALLCSLTYNARGWASGIETPAASIASLYDTAGYRVSRSENGVFTTYLRHGEHVEAIYDGSNTLAWEYFRGVVVDEIVNGYRYPTANANDKVNYSFHHDHLNSITALSGHEAQSRKHGSTTPSASP